MTTPAGDVFAALAPQLPLSMLEELTARYSEPHRRYHTAAHVQACFAARTKLAARLGSPPSLAVDLALLFHDIVYQPLATDNEERSAALLLDRGARVGLDPASVSRAATLIALTAHGHHQGSPADDGDDAALVLDADLSILGADESTFAQYERDVRAEYSIVDDVSYARGRAHVLAAILAQRPLYRTSAAQELWEDAARANLARSLSCGPGPRSPASPLAPAGRTSGSSRSGSAAARR